MTGFEAARPPQPRELIGTHASLVPLDPPAHAAALREADQAGDDSTWRWLPYGPFGSAAQFRGHLETLAGKPDPMFYCVLADGEPRGVLSLMEIVPEHGRIEIGHVWLSRPLQRTTAATEALFLAMAECFAVGNRRLEWKTDARNEPSRAAAERLGFTFEGVFRQHQWVNGENRDTAWFSLLDSEWPSVRDAIAAWLDPANFDAEGRQKTRLVRAATASPSSRS